MSQALDNNGYRSGFVALVGRPNVGKSSLINAILGKHLAITSPVPQTTRKRLRAVVTRPDYQLILLDTPGLHKPKDALGKELNRAALAALSDVDVVALLIDATRPVGRGDAWVARHVEASGAYKLLVITKADIANPEMIASQIEAAQQLAHFNDTIVVSAHEAFNVDGFVHLVAAQLPEGPRWFSEDADSDLQDEELIAEFVREKLLHVCRDELPHSIAVVCDELHWKRSGSAVASLRILVERESQKAIVVGAKGSMIKRVGSLARKELEQLFDCRFYLDVQVEVCPQWRRDAREIKRLGLDASE